jgi:hypothetical protein
MLYCKLGKLIIIVKKKLSADKGDTVNSTYFPDKGYGDISTLLSLSKQTFIIICMAYMFLLTFLIRLSSDNG